MMSETFRKKPVEIEAMQFDGTAESATPIIDWILTGEHAAHFTSMACAGDVPPWGISINTLEGSMLAGRGDWIIRGVQGEFYPCKSDIFEATYERVDSNEPLPEVPDGEAS